MDQEPDKHATRTEMKLSAKEILADGVAITVSAWEEQAATYILDWDQWPEAKQNEFRKILKHWADRAVQTLGYEESWKV